MTSWPQGAARDVHIVRRVHNDWFGDHYRPLCGGLLRVHDDMQERREVAGTTCRACLRAARVEAQDTARAARARARACTEQLKLLDALGIKVAHSRLMDIGTRRRTTKGRK